MNKLYEQFLLDDLVLKNRVVMAPLTRSRADLQGNPTDMMITYYGQRALAGLIIAEATQISQQGQGYIATPGIYKQSHVSAWQKVVDHVHANDGLICLQLWHVGRISHTDFQPNQSEPVAPSAIQAKSKVYNDKGFLDTSMPRTLDINEITDIVNQYAEAAKNAKQAG